MTKSFLFAAIFLIQLTQLSAQEWNKFSPLPDPEGFAALFAGVTHGHLLLAGGANFPDKKPWEGGKKVWHDTVYVLNEPKGTWKIAGRLPRPLAYGTAISFQNKVMCAGGSNSQGHFKEAFSLEFSNSDLRIEKLPSLPVPVANGAGVLVGESFHVVGGQDGPESLALNTHFILNLSQKNPTWVNGPTLPGKGRILPLAAVFQGKLYICGGAELKRIDGKLIREYLVDGYCYDHGKGWEKISPLPSPSVAPPSPAPVTPQGFFLLGGDNGKQLETPPDKHKGFMNSAWFYDAKKNQWKSQGEFPAPRVTVPCLKWQSWWLIPSGEIRPGIRSPEVWGFRPIE